ncbi:uncharacterized protein [Venturia canescens]|uniref:uncharacterized protein n=1 Tax=Venturia canescens TaxID=32260 RepID=UPI001C9D64FB|nr:uncharacterized protein LOC122408178 [Venturia canescens]
MARSFISIATILVLANFIFITSAIPKALPSYDISKLRDIKIVLTEIDSAQADRTTVFNKEVQGSGFIGDLEAGERRYDEKTYESTFTLENSDNAVFSNTLTFHVNEIGIFHYLRLTNDANSYLVACESSYTLGFTEAKVNVRAVPLSSSTYTVFAAIH